jgi:hypothetical protein
MFQADLKTSIFFHRRVSREPLLLKALNLSKKRFFCLNSNQIGLENGIGLFSNLKNTIFGINYQLPIIFKKHLKPVLIQLDGIY